MCCGSPTSGMPPRPPYESVKDRLAKVVEGKKFKAYSDGLVAKAKITQSL